MAATTRLTRGWGSLTVLALGVVATMAVLAGGGADPVNVEATRPRTVDGPAQGEDTSPGRYRETPDAANFVVHPERPRALGGSATTQERGRKRLLFSVSIAGHDATGSVSVQLTNVSGREMRFVDGLRVEAEVTRDGKPWRTFPLADPAVTSLAPGAEVSLQTSFPFEGPGQYSSWGSVEIELV